MTPRRPDPARRWPAGLPRATVRSAWTATPAVALVAALLAAAPLRAQDAGLPPRPFLDSIPVEPLVFDAVDADEYVVDGVTVFHIRDDALPLVDLAVHFEGGWSRVERGWWGAGSGLPALLRSGGTAAMTPLAFDEALERHAVQLTVGGTGSAITSSINVLVERLDTALALWGDMLRTPAFDTAAIGTWVGREVEAVRRAGDDPGRLAFAETNRLLYGDHPIGWEPAVEDFARDRVTPEVFRALHRRILCPDRMLLGVTGPLPWEELRPRIERLLADWPACGDPLPESPVPEVHDTPGVWIVPRELDQATLVVVQPVTLPQDDTPEWFASRIGHALLGASGLSSRLNQRLRTQLGFTYGAASVWTTPRRWPGLVGATTQVRPEVAVDALREIVAEIDRLRTEPPPPAEIDARVDEAVNGWVFNFESPARILGRRMAFRAGELPDDWLSLYLERISAVTPEAVRDVFREKVDPDGWVVIVVGDPARIGPELAEFGPITVLGGAGR